MSASYTRRDALRRITAVGAGLCLTAAERAGAKALPPSDRLDVAFVGAGGQAHFSLQGLADQNVVALCDVDDRRAAQAYRSHPKAKKFRGRSRPPQTLPRVKSHHQDWVQACKGGRPPLCNFPDFAAPLTEIMLLGALAQRLGKNIPWDSERMRAKDCPEAAPFIRRRYPKGWELTV